MKEHAEAITTGIIALMDSVEPEKPVKMTPEKHEKLVLAVGEALGILDILLPPLIMSIMRDVRAASEKLDAGR